jgi:hypothetical protein
VLENDRFLNDVRKCLILQAMSLFENETPVLLDSLDVSNQNDLGSYALMLGLTANYQAFTAPAGKQAVKLHSVKFSLGRMGTVAGTLVAKLYAASGAFPNAQPVGTALATSDPLDIATISAAATDSSGILYELFFTGANQIQLTAGTNYCIAIEIATGTFYNPNGVGVGAMIDWDLEDNPTHYGNSGIKSGNWDVNPSGDLIFYLYATT